MENSKFARYASIAEIISALAIVASLIYVANEFRRSETLGSAEVNALLFERSASENNAIIFGPGLAETIILARTEPNALAPADRLRYLAHQHNFFDSWEVAWEYYEDEIFNEEQWLSWDEWYADEARRRPVFGWVENRHNFSDGPFKDHVDELLGFTA